MLRQLEAAGLIRRVGEGTGPIFAIYSPPALMKITEGSWCFDGYNDLQKLKWRIF